MKPTDSFAMAITPCYLSMTVDNEYHGVCVSRRGIAVHLGKTTITVATEQELWDLLARDAPAFLSALAKSEQMYHQGLIKRAEVHLNYSPSYRESLEARFRETMLQINSVVLEALAARVRSKKPLMPHKTSSAKGVCWWEIKSSCFVPHLGAEPHRVHVRMFPSPLNEKAWSVHVHLPSFGLGTLMENQRRLKDAFSRLESLGIYVEDVTQGSWLVL